MAISQFSPSKRSQYDPSTKLKQRKASEFKKKPVKKNPCGTQHDKINKGETHNIEKSLISYEKIGDKTGDHSAYGKPKSSVLHRAHEVQAKLPSNFPCCVKHMLRSHVTGGFWLSLPKQFCNIHLPKKDGIVVLVDENGEEYKTKYLVEKNGLSGGWRGFSIAHNLLEGDVLVFQLIKPCVLKVYIVRANGLTELDGAICLLNLDFQDKSIDSANLKEENEDVKNCKTAEPDYSGPLANVLERGIVAVSSGHMPESARRSASDNNELSLEVLDGVRFSESDVQFKDVKGFNGFSILVDGLVIDSEIPLHLRAKYYQLCCSQNSFLHDHLIKGLNCKLAAGIISETVNIADAIRAAKLTTSCEYLQTWDKTLKAFEDMGMAVEFLRARIKALISLPTEQEESMKSRTAERAQLQEEMRNLETKLLNVKEVIGTVDADIKALEVQEENLEEIFKEKATAPW
ncbi:B3 domain-containing protein Os01g0234100 isoform X1 [Coffea arabica]|nr:B3 domain-containing protein Os01g0234100-like [Coffea arabica]